MAQTNLNFFTRDSLSCNEPEIMDRLSLLSPRPDSDDWQTELLSKIHPKSEEGILKMEDPKVIVVANNLEDSGVCMEEDEWRRSYLGEARSPVPLPMPIQIGNEELPHLQESDEVITELTLNVVDVVPTMDEFWNLNASEEPKSYPQWLVEGKQEPPPKKKKPKKLNIPLAQKAEVTDIINTPTLDDIIGATPSDNILQWVIDETIAPDEEFPGMLSEIGDDTPKPAPLLPKPKSGKKRDRSPWIVAEPALKVRRKTMPTKLSEYSVEMPWVKPENNLKDQKKEMSTDVTKCSLPDWLKKEGLIQDEETSMTTVDTEAILIPQWENKVPSDYNGETVIKRKRGRPAKNTVPYITPKLPRQKRTKYLKAQTDSDDHSYVPEELKDDMKYRRMRDLNNEASRKCRIKRKNKFGELLEEKEKLQIRNNELREMVTRMETEKDAWKTKVDLKAANVFMNSGDLAFIDDGLEAVTSHDDGTAFYGSHIGAEVGTLESTWSLNV